MRTPISPLPDTAVIEGDQDSRFTKPWWRFFSDLFSAPEAYTAIPPGASPFIYEASQDGVLYVSGGTVTVIAITRGADTIDTGVIAGPIPMAKGDLVSIVYAVAPTITFAES